MTWNPYAYAGERWPDWVIRFDHLHGIPEVMCWTRRVVLIDPAPGRHGRRCSMAHAIGHLELMHQGDVVDRREEAAANKWAAGMLIGVRELAAAAQWHDWQVGEDLAAELRVDLETLTTRVQMAQRHPAEAAFLRSARSRLEHAA